MITLSGKHEIGRRWFVSAPEILSLVRERSQAGSGVKEDDIRKILEEDKVSVSQEVTDFISKGVFDLLRNLHRQLENDFSFYTESTDSNAPLVPAQRLDELNTRLQTTIRSRKELNEKMPPVYEAILKGDFDLYKRTMENQVHIPNGKLKVRYEGLLRGILEIIKNSTQTKTKEKENFLLKYRTFLSENILHDLNIDKAVNWGKELAYLRIADLGKIVPLKARLDIVNLIDKEAKHDDVLTKLIEAHDGDYSKVMFYLFAMPALIS